MKATILLPAFSALLLMAPTLKAQSVINYDFQDGSTAGWNIHSSQSHSYLSVIEDPVRGGGNSVLKVDASYGGLDMLRVALPESLTSGTYVMKLQIMVTGTDGAAPSPQYAFDRRISFLDSSALTTRTSTYTRFRRYGAGNELSSYSGSVGTGGTPGWDGVNPMAYNQWYEITQTINIDAQTWEWSVDNLTTGASIYESGTLGFTHDVHDLRHLVFLKIGEATSGVFYLDNVQVAVIPEPSSTAMVLAAGVIGAAGFSIRSARKKGGE